MLYFVAFNANNVKFPPPVQIRLQYITGIDNAPGVTSTKLEPLPGSASVGASRSHSRSVSRGAISSAALAAAVDGKLDSFDLQHGDGYPGINLANRARSSSSGLGGSFSLTGTEEATFDPNSAYAVVSADPTQAFRKHLSYKAGITPGKILAARRKENAIQRAQKAAEALEQAKPSLFEVKL